MSTLTAGRWFEIWLLALYDFQLPRVTAELIQPGKWKVRTSVSLANLDDEIRSWNNDNINKWTVLRKRVGAIVYLQTEENILRSSWDFYEGRIIHRATKYRSFTFIEAAESWVLLPTKSPIQSLWNPVAIIMTQRAGYQMSHDSHDKLGLPVLVTGWGEFSYDFISITVNEWTAKKPKYKVGIHLTRPPVWVAICGSSEATYGRCHNRITTAGILRMVR